MNILAILSALLLAGCHHHQPASVADPAEDVLYTDTLTGCQYIQLGARSGITPRIAADGRTHMGCKAVQP